MKYGTTPPAANAGVEFLFGAFGDRILAHYYRAKLEETYQWPSTPLNLNQYVYFFWRFLKE
jgi:hypothetical protein